MLDESVYGDFSTRPADTKLYMQDILRHVTGALPMHLLMFKDIKVPKMMGELYLNYMHGLNLFLVTIWVQSYISCACLYLSAKL